MNGSELTNNLLSYGNFLEDIKKFKKAGTKNGDEFNYLDTPSHLYFKILFNFWNGDIDNPGNKTYSGGLLSPTWSIIGNDDKYYNYNSAWAYLKANNENERAEKLEKFVELLSNISTYSPWYFQSIEGLDQARTRNAPSNGEFKFEDRNKITIKCLNDSYDDRIGTLLDLYRDVVWSWALKKEIIPSNLRKFDMAIYIFSSPIFNIHNYNKNFAGVGSKFNGYITSYKYLEFHNCEIEYNSAVSGLSTLDNSEGFSPQYSIDIYFDDLYENRYNEFMMRDIGDMIAYDLAESITDNNGNVASLNTESIAQTDSDSKRTETEARTFYYDNENGILANMMNDATNWLINKGESFITQLYLGNIFGFSLKNAFNNYENLSQGKLFSTIDAINDYSTLISQSKSKNHVKNLGNIFKNQSIKNNI